MKTEEEIKRRIQFLNNGIVYAKTRLDNISCKCVILENEIKINTLKWVLGEVDNDRT
jgi:hypothetical protein